MYRPSTVFRENRIFAKPGPVVIADFRIMIIGSLEMIVLIYTYNVLADSAKEGVRYAVVHGSRNSTPSGPTCPCADIDGPAAPTGSYGGYYFKTRHVDDAPPAGAWSPDLPAGKARRAAETLKGS